MNTARRRRVRHVSSGLDAGEPGGSRAGAVLVQALADPALRVRKAALELVESLGPGGAAFLEGLRQSDGLEEEADLRDALARLVERLGRVAGAEPPPVADG